MKDRKVYLVAGMLGLLFSGVLYAWSILKAPLASEFGWTAGELGRNFTITISIFAIGGFIGGKLVKKVPLRGLLLSASAVTFLGFLCCSQLRAEGIALLYLFYGGFCGIGIGIAYNAIVSATTAWYPDKRGLCSGALMMCFGTSTLLLGSMATSMMNAWGWRQSYIVIGAIIAGALLLNAVVLKAPEGFYSTAAAEKAAEAVGDTPRKILHKASFWAFCAYIITLCAGANMVISFGSDIAVSMGATAGMATTLVGVLSVCNGLGRLICGFVSDRIKIIQVMLIASAIALTAILLMWFAAVTGSLVVGSVGMALVGIGYGFSPTIISAFCAKIYGPAHFSENFSLASFTLIPCSFAASIAGAMVMASGDYTSTLMLGSTLSAISILFAILAGKVSK